MTPILLTPGPLTTREETRRAMLRDWGSRDGEFIALTAEVRSRLLAVANAAETHVAVPLQGSGTFIVEAAIGTLVGPADKLLVLINGAYGERIARIAGRLGRSVEAMMWEETDPIDPAQVEQALRADPAITDVAAVHCETTTGILNPLADSDGDEEHRIDGDVDEGVPHMAAARRHVAEPGQFAVGAVEEGRDQPQPAGPQVPIGLAGQQGRRRGHPDDQAQRGQVVGRDAGADQRPHQRARHLMGPRTASGHDRVSPDIFLRRGANRRFPSIHCQASSPGMPRLSSSSSGCSKTARSARC